MFFDPRSVGGQSPVMINGKSIEQVTSHEYLGVYMDSLLCWSSHVNSLCSRLQQRLYFLQRLKVFGVNQRILFLFYQSVFESLIRYGIAAWYGNLTVQSKSKLAWLVQTLKVVGLEEKRPIQEMYEVSVLRHAKKIVADDTHILHVNFNMLPSGRRLRILMCKSNRYCDQIIETEKSGNEEPVQLIVDFNICVRYVIYCELLCLVWVNATYWPCHDCPRLISQEWYNKWYSIQFN